MNQNKHVFFTTSISALPPMPQPAPAFTPTRQPSWPLSGHSPGLTPLTLGPTNSTPRIHHHLLLVSCLGQGSRFQELLQLVPCQAGRVWAGSEAWEYPRDGRGSALGNVAYWTPLLPPAGCFFMTVRVQLSDNWLPASSSQEFEGWVPGC